MNLKIRLGLQVVLSSVLLFAASVDFAGLGKLKAASQKFGKPIISTPTVFQPVVKKARQKGAVRQSQGTHGGFENQNKTQRQTGKEFGLRQANGVLNEIAVPLAKLLKFKRRGKHLVFELPSSYSEADEAFRKIRSQARGGGGGHSSGEFWTQYVSNQNFGGRIQKSEQNIGGVRKNRPDSYLVEFLESTGNGCGIEVQGESPGQFGIRIDGGHLPGFLQILQGEDYFAVQEVTGLTAFAGSANSFQEFCENHPDFVQSHLIPVLKRFGFLPPVTRFNSVTRDYVLELLSPVDSELLNTFKNEFEDLESTKYELRQAATRKLNTDYAKWKDAVRFAVGNDQFGVEVRSRLQKLIKEKSRKTDRELIALVDSGDLVNNRNYLIWLLSHCRDALRRQQVVDQLKKLTDQDHGLDAERWRAWAQRTISPKTTGIPVEIGKALTQVNGYLPQMAEPTSKLLQLKVSDGKITVDPKAWADQFNGESIKTLVKRVQDQLKASNLPARWLKFGKPGVLEVLGHEHVLFEHIQAAIPPQVSPNYFVSGNLTGYDQRPLNRTVEQPHLILRLIREKQNRADKFGQRQAPQNKTKLFHYEVRERRGSHMVLSLTEHLDTSLCLRVSSLKAKALFQLFQNPDGRVACHILVGGSQRSISAASFEELYEQHQKFLVKEIYPVFARFGIQVTPAMGGPLEIKNTARPAQKSRL